VSIRQIADEAQVPLALVGYYFGAKQQLYHAIFEHWSSIIKERLSRAENRHGRSDRRPAHTLVEAFITR